MTAGNTQVTIPSRIGTKVAKELRRFGARLWALDTRVIRHGGLLWLLNRKNRVDRKVICGGYEQEQVNFLFSRMKNGCDYFFDIGANFGLYTLQVAASGYAREIHAFEPDPRNYAQLQANLYLNGLTTIVKSHPLVLSDSAKQVDFEIYPVSSTGQSRVIMGTPQTQPQQAAQVMPLPAAPLDSVFPALQGKTIFMKIDVEGHEREMLRGAENTLRNNRCFLQIEAWPGQEETLKSHMESIGYRCIHSIKVDYYFTNGDL